jgi:hypothetical protein
VNADAQTVLDLGAAVDEFLAREASSEKRRQCLDDIDQLGLPLWEQAMSLGWGGLMERRAWPWVGRRCNRLTSPRSLSGSGTVRDLGRLVHLGSASGGPRGCLGSSCCSRRGQPSGGTRPQRAVQQAVSQFHRRPSCTVGSRMATQWPDGTQPGASGKRHGNCVCDDGRRSFAVSGAP